ncbi:mannose/fructose/sorbose PTS transporter subunit IIA [Azotosporobacter soli]|uniref:PTS sugar transporter subunit IIA n=1 Tax=Azotosporobacter soli TaxID=3055040 RepID=UPI0031FE522A
MIGLIVCTHGKFSEELVKASEMIFGKQEKVKCITFEPGESADGLVEKYKTAIAELGEKDGVLFVVDLFGGSPYNAASRIVAQHENMDIVAGVNLPMLLEVYMPRTFMGLPDLVETAMTAGRNAVQSFSGTYGNVVEEEL